ncbi:MAG: O-antigen ligase family protein [Caldilineaceae bacterium]
MMLFGILPVAYLVNDAIATDEYSYSTRVDALLIMLEMARVSPLLGFGPANYYWYTPLYRIRGWEVKFNSHNQYADILAQIGLIGMACFLWFFGELAWLAWKLRNEVTPGFNQAYVYGVIGGIAGTLVAAALADWVIPFVYNIGMRGFRGSMLGWLFLGGLLSIEHATRAGCSTSVATP